MPGPLVVDLDGVLRVWDAAISGDAERLHGLPDGRIGLAAFGDQDRLARAITGEITDEQWREEIARELEASFGAAGRSAVQQWSTPAGRVDGAVREILQRERGQRRVVLFTNATTRLDSDLDRLGISHDFDLVLNSSSLGMAKPSIAAFEAVAAALHAYPSECLFVDDAPDNVRAAQRVGFRAHLFVSTAALVGFLDSEN
jgi:putative hydrolase of the HAD superfamily